MFSKHRFMLRQYWISTFVLISSLVITGCTWKSKGKPILPQQGPTMSEIYRNHQDEVGYYQNTQPQFTVQVDEAKLYDSYAQDALSEIDTLFPVLPNPTLVMYVAPHLAGEDMAPVPGYFTSFPLYERQHYALPGEVISQ